MRPAPSRSESSSLIPPRIGSATRARPCPSAPSSFASSITSLRVPTASSRAINSSIQSGALIVSSPRAASMSMSAACAKKSKAIPSIPRTRKPFEARAICLKPVRRTLFWKLALTFFGLLAAVLLTASLFAERALRRDYQRTGFSQLAAVAHVALARPPKLPVSSPPSPEQKAALLAWTRELAASGARVTVIAADGTVLADSQSDTSTMENHAGRPEIRDALRLAEGRSVRHSVTIGRDLLYLAVRADGPPGSAPLVLRFALPLETVDQALISFHRSLWLFSIVILLLAFAAALLVSRGLTHRIERLREFSRRVAEGDFRPIAADRSGDALDALGASLNQTAARLDATIRSLTEERNLSSAILDSMVEGVVVVDAAERIVFANRGFASILEL